MRSRLQGWHPEESLRHLIHSLKELVEHPNLERKMLMSLIKEVQDQVDRTRELTSVVASVHQGLGALTAQIAVLKGQIASASSLSAEDKAGLIQSVADTQGAIDTLKVDIPANTSAATEPVPVETPPAPEAPPSV